MPSNPEFGSPPVESKPNLFPRPQTPPQPSPQVVEGLGQAAIRGSQRR